MGYLFMEYVPGQSLQDVDLKENIDIISRVARILKHLGDIRDGQVPGPIGTGEPQGYIWGDDGARATFDSMADMEDWLNKRLLMHEKSINLSSCPLVFCHMDLCRRNMILEEDDTICLLDWGFAGLYPRFFEIISLSCMSPYDEPYEKPLLEATKSLFRLTEEENRNMSLVKRARALNLRYSFNDDSAFGLPAGFHLLPPLPPLPDQPPSP
ncbi:hypothetical protein IFR05_015637 [Cadophora sp. M221]|nr:hypothetical protein IFR05_015637 [Cadophora sp. M221]